MNADPLAPLMFAVYDNAGGAPIVIMPRWDEREALRRGLQLAAVWMVMVIASGWVLVATG